MSFSEIEIREENENKLSHSQGGISQDSWILSSRAAGVNWKVEEMNKIK